ncbi:putative F-box/LRR-repeat protein-like [Capsicum annuum]|nr:putative F-box/LRR-repeat protein-like [Capsicum annuum]
MLINMLLLVTNANDKLWAYESSALYKEKMKLQHDWKIEKRVFDKGGQVLLYQSKLHLFQGKLRSRWCGLYTVIKFYPYGTLELKKDGEATFKNESYPQGTTLHLESYPPLNPGRAPGLYESKKRPVSLGTIPLKNVSLSKQVKKNNKQAPATNSKSSGSEVDVSTDSTDKLRKGIPRLKLKFKITVMGSLKFSCLSVVSVLENGLLFCLPEVIQVYSYVGMKREEKDLEKTNSDQTFLCGNILILHCGEVVNSLKMESDKSKGTGSSSTDMCSPVEFKGFNGKSCGVGPDKYDTTKLEGRGEVHIADVGKIILPVGVKKVELCAKENQQTSMKDGLDKFEPSLLRSDEGTSLEMLTSLKQGESKNVFGFGDLVWAKVRSHPWWPGQIYDESLIPSPLDHAMRDGSVLVTFFGDYSYAWLDHDQIIPFAPHFEEKSSKSKLPTFIEAVEEAIDELKKRAVLGLTCFCQGNFQPTRSEGLYEVDLSGYDPGAIYSSKQIKKSRDGFQPHGMLSFVKKLAKSPKSLQNVYWIINSAKVTAYRKAVFEENDESYDQAFEEFEKSDEAYNQACGVKASRSADPVEFSKDGNQFTGTVGAQVEAAAPNGPRVSVTSTELADLQRNNGINMEKPSVDVALQKSGPAALHYEHMYETSVYCKMRRSGVSKVLDKSKISQALNVPIMITEEKLQNVKCPTLPFDASVLKNWEKSFDDQGDCSKESCRGETKRKRREESPPDDQGRKGKFQKDAFFDYLVTKSGEEADIIYCCKGEKHNKINDYGEELGNATGVLKHLKQFRSTFYEKEHEKTYKKPTLLKCQDERMTRKEELRGLKSLHMTKKYGDRKPLTPQDGDDIDIDIQSTSSVQSENFIEEPERKAEPTMLVLKFSPQTMLPTASELKAKFAYFGPFDETALCISWVLAECRIVFMNKSNAQAAYDYAVQNRTLFNSDVNYHLKDFDGSEKLMKESFDDIQYLEGESHPKSFQELPLQFDTEMKSSLPQENSKCRSDLEEEAYLKDNTDANSIVCDYTEVDVKVNGGSENSQVVLSEILCASSPVSSSIQYKHKVGSLDETVVAINAKYSMDERWKSHYQQYLSSVNSSDLSLQLANLFEKCNEILGGIEGSQEPFSSQSQLK